MSAAPSAPAPNRPSPIVGTKRHTILALVDHSFITPHSRPSLPAAILADRLSKLRTSVFDAIDLAFPDSQVEVRGYPGILPSTMPPVTVDKSRTTPDVERVSEVVRRAWYAAQVEWARDDALERDRRPRTTS